MYLLNNCGQLVHSWIGPDEYQPGNGVYLLPDGNLVRTRRHQDARTDPIWAGGGGEFVEVLSWDNEVLASFQLNDTAFRLHHDVAPLPNGNILMIAWELYSDQQALDAGRDPEKLSSDELWSEIILEWNPINNEIVWQWRVWDHLIQGFDSEKANFGIVADHPELIDLNYDTHEGHPDWLHINSIDYNPVLDQIVLSVPYFDEFWIIDHSTTTAEAASHAGGNSEKGGDLLYRWGNPQAYAQLVENKLFFQHDVHWVNPNARHGDDDFGLLALFNNRIPNDISRAEVINSKVSNRGAYTLVDNVFIPTSFERSITHPDRIERAQSPSVSSAQFFPNGNVLICSGIFGYSYEMNANDQVVWEFVTPIRGGQIVEQGTELERNDNFTFRLKRYETDYPAFVGRDLSSRGFIEINPVDLCMTTNTLDAPKTEVHIYPNPTKGVLTIDGYMGSIQIFDLMGVKQTQFEVVSDRLIHLKNLPAGSYILRLSKGLSRRFVVSDGF